MNNIIPFKKSIIFKTKIAEITDISLTHDYKVLDDMVEGEFYLSGEYKMTEASVINEDFYYNIPFSIALGDRIKKESINLLLEDFKYSHLNDTLIINVDLNMEYEENEIEEERSVDEVIEEIKNEVKVEEKEALPEMEEVITNEPIINPVESEISNNAINNLLTNIASNNEFTTYKVHIVRNDDSFESIAAKYNVSLDNIKEYNKTENINVGDKILVPFIYNE